MSPGFSTTCNQVVSLTVSRYLSQYIAKAWNEHVLLSVLIELTYTCNLRCHHCYCLHEKEKSTLSIDDYRLLLEDGRKLGCIYLTLTGGEPLLHKCFKDIVTYAIELRYIVRIKTNGLLLNFPMIDFLVKVGVYGLDISIHGADSKTHDAMTGIEGSFDQLIKNVSSLKSEKMKITFSCPVTILNQHQLFEIHELVRSWGFSVDFDPEIRQRYSGDDKPLELKVDKEGKDSFLQIQKQKKRELENNNVFLSPEDIEKNPPGELSKKNALKYYCGAGIGNLSISPNGDVYPCVIWREKIGSLKEKRLIQIWKNSAALDKLRKINLDLRQRKKHAPMDEFGIVFCPGRDM